MPKNRRLNPKIWWYSLSLQTKLLSIFSFFVIVISLLNTYTLATAFSYLGTFQGDLRRSVGIHAFQSDLDQSHGYFENYAMSGNSENMEQFYSSSPTLWARWNEVNRDSATSQEAIFEIRAAYYGLRAYFETGESVAHLEPSGPEYIGALLRTRRIYDYLRDYLQELQRIRLREGAELLEVQTAQVRQTQCISYGSLIALALILSIIGSRFAKSLSQPIQTLATRASQIAQGDLTTPDINSPRGDEIGILAQAFNRMNQNIHSMVESLKEKVDIEKQLFEDERKIIEMNRSLREAQFLNLQAQISPHFFFNTLNTISRMSMFEKAPETLKLIQSLTAIFRYTLVDRSKTMGLKEELEILTEYLHIQKTRYGERLRASIEVEPGLDTSQIYLPVFSLQPLVENSIKYAVEPREEGALIEVKIHRKEEQVLITLWDDGPGLSSESQAGSGIGLRNVQSRLEMSFGPGCFAIHSQPEGGTLVTLKIPATQEEL